MRTHVLKKGEKTNTHDLDRNHSCGQEDQIDDRETIWAKMIRMLKRTRVKGLPWRESRTRGERLHLSGVRDSERGDPAAAPRRSAFPDIASFATNSGTRRPAKLPRIHVI